MTILLYDLVGRDEARPYSPHCWKVKMALAHKGLRYRTVPTRFLEIPRVENGASKTVPVIRDGDRVVADSFDIALYLDEAYPERPSLFAGEGGRAIARFIERWSQTIVHAYLRGAAILDIHAMQDEDNGEWFRNRWETASGKTLAELNAGRAEGLPAFRVVLEPLRSMLSHQPWIGGASPLFPDYIVFGAFQWARTTTRFDFLAEGDPVAEWFGRCLALHGGLGASVRAAV